MGWRSDTTLGALVFEEDLLTEDQVAVRDEELAYLMQKQRGYWSLINGRIAASGHPMATAGVYAGLAAYPMPIAIAGPAMSTTEAGIISAGNIAIYTPMPASVVTSPQMWEARISGTYTVGATPGTIAFTPRLGNANTSPSLGASAAITQTNLTNAFWRFSTEITIASIGAPGANSKANATSWAQVNTAVGGAFNSAVWGTGTTDVSFDATIALGTNGGGLWLGGTDAGATNHATYTVRSVRWSSWN